MNANVCVRAPEETAEQGLRESPILIMKDTIPRTLLPGNLSQKQNWGMCFVCQDLKACALIRPQHRWVVNQMTAAKLQQIAYSWLISPSGKHIQISNRQRRTDNKTWLCLQFIETEVSKMLKQKCAIRTPKECISPLPVKRTSEM